MGALDGGRINIGACSVGGAARAVDAARSYAAGRSLFGSPLASLATTRAAFADMTASVQASRLLVRNAARNLDAGAPTATLDAALAKKFATDACFEAANRALQVFGGYGYLADYHAERTVRDLRVHSILEGANEVMSVIVSRELDRLDG
jgi:alkylation response protein AidB-like acyl-CoA dehydrogenase